MTPDSPNPTLMRAERNTFTTQSGRRFNLADPRPDSVDPGDIAWALSHLCRYNGHLPRFYSVAEHSIHVCAAAAQIYVEDCLARGEVPNAFDTLVLQRAALLHDATEAYCGDCISPLKNLLPEYRIVEARVAAAVSQRFGLSTNRALLAIVDTADKRVFAAECVQIRGYDRERFSHLVSPSLYDERWQGSIRCLSPEDARRAFTAVMRDLGVA